MDEYVSKKALLKAVDEDFNKDWGERGTNGDWDYIDGARDEYDDVIDIICQIPAADVQPVKHGRWIDHEKFERKNCNVCIECSVCNTWFGHDCIPKTKFCPNCGARMDGDTE